MLQERILALLQDLTSSSTITERPCCRVG